MPLLKRKRVLSAAIEATAYTAEALNDVNDTSFNVYDPIIQPTIEMIGRPRQGSFAHLPDAIGTRMGTCTFKTDFFNDGNAPPNWAGVFLPACGWYNSGASLFVPIAEVPGTNVKTLTMAMYVDGLRKAIRGAVGTFRIMIETGKPTFIEFTFIGAWTGVADATLLAPTYPTVGPERFANATMTIGAMTPCFASATIDAGNTTIMRECQTASDASGYVGGLITDRMPTITINPEAALTTGGGAQTFPTDWLTPTPRAITFTYPSSNIVIAAGAAQLTNVQEGDRNGMVTDELTFKCTGNDATSLTMTFTEP